LNFSYKSFCLSVKKRSIIESAEVSDEDFSSSFPHSAPEKLEWAAKSYDIISFEKYIDYEGMVSEDIMSSQSLEDFVENDMRRS